MCSMNGRKNGIQLYTTPVTNDIDKSAEVTMGGGVGIGGLVGWVGLTRDSM